jgi:hypothetical protein
MDIVDILSITPQKKLYFFEVLYHVGACFLYSTLLSMINQFERRKIKGEQKCPP